MEFVLPGKKNCADVTAFYDEIRADGGECIGIGGYEDYDSWLEGMINRHEGRNLPEGYVREDFYLCYDEGRMVGVFSIKFELTQYLLDFGGHIGYAVAPSCRNRGLATKILKKGIGIAENSGFDRLLCICDEDNAASEKVIVRNGGIFENRLYDPEEDVNVNRYWIQIGSDD